MRRAFRTGCAAAALLLGTAPIWITRAADAPPATVTAQTPDDQPSEDNDRRRPGAQPEPERVAPVTDPNAVPPPQRALPREFIPLPDRWRITDTLGVTHADHIYDPYHPNILKG